MLQYWYFSSFINSDRLETLKAIAEDIVVRYRQLQMLQIDGPYNGLTREEVDQMLQLVFGCVTRAIWLVGAPNAGQGHLQSERVAEMRELLAMLRGKQLAELALLLEANKSRLSPCQVADITSLVALYADLMQTVRPKIRAYRSTFTEEEPLTEDW